MQSVRIRVVVLGTAVAALFGGVPIAAASAGPGQADLSASIYPPNSPVATDADSDYEITIYNAGDDSSGGDAAAGVTLKVVVTGGTLVSVAENSTDNAPLAACTKKSTTEADCTVPGSFAVYDSKYVDAIVTGGNDHGSESVTATVGQTPTNADPDNSNNSVEADCDTVTPPASTLSEASATPDTDDDGVTLQATLKVNGSGISDEEVDVYVKPQGDPDSSYLELGLAGYSGDDGTHPGTVHINVDEYFLADGSLATQLGGPVTFRLTHPADANADAASATIDVTPRPVTVTADVPTAETYSRTAQVTIKGSAALAGHPNLPLSGELELQSRPAGSSAAWQDTTLYNQGQPDAAVFTDQPRHNTDYRLVYESISPGSATTASGAKTLTVNSRVKAVTSPSAVPAGAKSAVEVTVGPTDSGGKVTLERQAGGKWKKLAHASLSGKSKHTWSYRYSHLGSRSYRVVAAATSSNGGNTSAIKKLTVEKHGGGSSKQHTFLYSNGSTYARWNPCKPIHYQVNTKEAPKGALAAVKETIRRISQITKLHFDYDGKTHFIPSQSRIQHEPVVIAWAHQSQTDFDISNGIIGEGGGTYEEYGTEKPVVTEGYAVLLAGYKLTPGFGAGTTEGDLLMHELGHMTGLDHVTQQSQIMYPEILPRSTSIYGAGDYRGLQLLGRSQGCLKAPPKSARMGQQPASVPHVHVFESSAP